MMLAEQNLLHCGVRVAVGHVALLGVCCVWSSCNLSVLDRLSTSTIGAACSEQQLLDGLLRIGGQDGRLPVARSGLRRGVSCSGGPCEQLLHLLLSVARGIRCRGRTNMNDKCCGDEAQRTAAGLGDVQWHK